MENDAFFKLEHEVLDERKAVQSATVLTRLQRLNDAQWSDPYTQSQQLRRKFREQKKVDKANVDKKDKLREKMSLHIDLLDEDPADDIQAKLIEFADPVVTGAEKRKQEIQVGPLFNKRTHGSGSAKEDLAARLVRQTRKKVDPFLQGSNSFNSPAKRDMPSSIVLKPPTASLVSADPTVSLPLLVSMDYTDSDDSEA